jgi:hypothetical protein
MLRAALVLAGCFATLTGCQTLPERVEPPRPTEPMPRPAQHAITVFEQVPADADAVKQAVLGHVPPGTPADQAQAILEAQGFVCRSANPVLEVFHPDALNPERVDLESAARKRIAGERNRIYCHATVRGLEEWHLVPYHVLIVLVSGTDDRIRAIEVGVKRDKHRYAKFFEERRDLREPVGLPAPMARAQMEAAGFCCTEVNPEATARDVRPYVLCEAFEETLINGHVIRVHLYPDAAGVIRETFVPDEGRLFDAERCMLPHGDEPSDKTLRRCMVFPLRVGCRYTLITLAVCTVIVATPLAINK